MTMSADFHVKNGRRLVLIDKMLSGFTAEESKQSFDVPGWRAEHDRRCRANLTDAERAELAALSKFVDEEMSQAYPLDQVWLEGWA